MTGLRIRPPLDRDAPAGLTFRVAVGLVLSTLATACEHTNTPIPPAIASATASPATASPREGEVAVEFLADPIPPDEKLDEAHEFVPASLLLMPTPVYPQAALARGELSALVGVRLSINAAGVVEDVMDSPRLVPYSGPFALVFRQAVEDAVRRWRFTSARIQTLGPAGPDSERPVTATLRVPTYLDFAFRFSVVEGRGVVTVGAERPVAAPSTPPERVK